MNAFQPNVQLAGLGGCDSTTPAHLLDAQHWVACHNMRPFMGSLVQVPLLSTYFFSLPTLYTILHLQTIPTGIQDRCFTIALTEASAYQCLFDDRKTQTSLPEIDED